MTSSMDELFLSRTIDDDLVLRMKIKKACFEGDVVKIKMLAELAEDRIGMKKVSDYILESGNLEVVEWLLGSPEGCFDSKSGEFSPARGKNYIPKSGLYRACKGGNVDVVELLIENGAIDYNLGFIGACRSGNKELMDLMLEKSGEDRFDNETLNRAFRKACKSGKIEIVKSLFEEEKYYGANDYNQWLYGACSGGNLDIFNLVCDYGANDWETASYYASKSNSADILNILFEKKMTARYAGIGRLKCLKKEMAYNL